MFVEMGAYGEINQKVQVCKFNFGASLRRSPNMIGQNTVIFNQVYGQCANFFVV